MCDSSVPPSSEEVAKKNLNTSTGGTTAPNDVTVNIPSDEGDVDSVPPTSGQSQPSMTKEQEALTFESAACVDLDDVVIPSVPRPEDIVPYPSPIEGPRFSDKSPLMEACHSNSESESHSITCPSVAEDEPYTALSLQQSRDSTDKSPLVELDTVEQAPSFVYAATRVNHSHNADIHLDEKTFCEESNHLNGKALPVTAQTVQYPLMHVGQPLAETCFSTVAAEQRSPYPPVTLVEPCTPQAKDSASLDDYCLSDTESTCTNQTIPYPSPSPSFIPYSLPALLSDLGLNLHDKTPDELTAYPRSNTYPTSECPYPLIDPTITHQPQAAETIPLMDAKSSDELGKTIILKTPQEYSEILIADDQRSIDELVRIDLLICTF